VTLYLVQHHHHRPHPEAVGTAAIEVLLVKAQPHLKFAVCKLLGSRSAGIIHVDVVVVVRHVVFSTMAMIEIEIEITVVIEIEIETDHHKP